MLTFHTKEKVRKEKPFNTRKNSYTEIQKPILRKKTILS